VEQAAAASESIVQQVRDLNAAVASEDGEEAQTTAPRAVVAHPRSQAGVR
jgi:hypothetical protein